MSSIVRFLSDDGWRLSTLKDIDAAIAGKRVADLRDSKPALRKYYDRVRNFTLPITVIRCDHSKTSHMDYLFTIFHRLNTGSAKLTNQEIRNCIYSGIFNNFLREVDRDQTWLTMNGGHQAKVTVTAGRKKYSVSLPFTTTIETIRAAWLNS